LLAKKKEKRKKKTAKWPFPRFLAGEEDKMPYRRLRGRSIRTKRKKKKTSQISSPYQRIETRCRTGERKKEKRGVPRAQQLLFRIKEKKTHFPIVSSCREKEEKKREEDPVGVRKTFGIGKLKGGRKKKIKALRPGVLAKKKKKKRRRVHAAVRDHLLTSEKKEKKKM